MKITISRADGYVVVDGEVRKGLNLSYLNSNVLVIQYDTVAGTGEVETDNPRANTKLVSANYDAFVLPGYQAWQAAETNPKKADEKDFKDYAELAFAKSSISEAILTYWMKNPTVGLAADAAFIAAMDAYNTSKNKFSKSEIEALEAKFKGKVDV